jgi:hypothetical protein
MELITRPPPEVKHGRPGLLALTQRAERWQRFQASETCTQQGPHVLESLVLFPISIGLLECAIDRSVLPLLRSVG